MRNQRRFLLLLIVSFAIVPLALLAGCSGGQGRDTSTPAKALLGHWQVKDANTTIITWDDIYFDGSTVYYSEGTGETSTANKHQDRYTVVSSSTKPFSILLEYPFKDITTGKLMTARKTAVFSDDKTEFTFKNNTDTRESKEESGPYKFTSTETKP